MTPAEFLLQVDGHKARDEHSWRKMAWQTAHLLNIWLKKQDRVTVEDLLKKNEPKPPMTDDHMAENAIAWAIALGGVDKRKKKNRKGG